MDAFESFYERLGVDPDASEEVIERAYRELAKQHHPDVDDHPDASERFRRLSRARDVLTDPTERARYDRLGHEAYRRREAGATDSGGSDRNTPEESSTSERARANTTSDGEDDRREDSGRDRARSSSQTSSGSETGSRGRLGEFALGEAVGAVTLAVLGGGLLWLVALAAARTDVGGRVTLAAVAVGWAFVALVAGHLAGRWADVLPDDVVRAHAFPLVLLVCAWYAEQMGAPTALVGGLAAYGGFTALFRTTALVAGDGQMGRPVVLWFLGTVPAALVGYLGYAGGGRLGRTVVRRANAVVPVGLGVEMVAVAAPVVVVVGHALWRSWRALR